MKKFSLPKNDYDTLEVQSECTEGLNSFSNLTYTFAIILIIANIIIGLFVGIIIKHIILGFIAGILLSLPTYLALKFLSLTIEALKEIVENLNVLNRAYIFNNIKNENNPNDIKIENSDNSSCVIDVEIKDNTIRCPKCSFANYKNATKCKYCGQPFNIINNNKE